MNELTLFLAGAVVLAHCAVIFWPRKPLDVATDENGLPILWCNESAQKTNVACVWDEPAMLSDSSKAETSSAGRTGGQHAAASFSASSFAMPSAEGAHRRVA